MSKQRSKCIIILSEKSSGSSACQNLIHDITGAKYITKTRHFENESLYWTKAASVLGMEQLRAQDSEVPIGRGRAKKDLLNLLQSNVPGYVAPAEDRAMIFEGWKRLCESHGPIFLEKSPHHLYQWSALQLIQECMVKYPEIDFLIVGLIRNPMDTIYSQFKRWRSVPEKVQFQWLSGYQNMRRLKAALGEKMVIVRYEDMVSSLDCMMPVFRFCGLGPGDIPANTLYRDALRKWKSDRRFGFAMAEPVKQLARSYGYSDRDLENGIGKAQAMIWPAYRSSLRILYKAKQYLKKELLWRTKAPTLNGAPSQNIQRAEHLNAASFSHPASAAIMAVPLFGPVTDLL